MINFDQIGTLGQIAFALLIIAFAVVYYVSTKKTTRSKHGR
jgi:hypothetical protein